MQLALMCVHFVLWRASISATASILSAITSTNIYRDSVISFLHTDINECLRGTDQCSKNATCSDTIGSYTCSCNTGFSGDGFNCNGRESVIQ